MKKYSINWINHFVELAVVFIGIYGAFALNSWNDSRKESLQEKKYLHNLLSEIKFDNDQLSLIIERIKEDSTKIDSLILMLKNKKVKSEEILPFLNIMSRAEKFAPRNITFESIRNAGGLEIISNFELRKLITENYILYNNLIVVENITLEFLKDFWLPYSMKQFDIIKNKIINKSFVTEVEFGNLVGGYYSSIIQQINSYRKAHNKCSELIIALEKELNQ